MKERIKGLFSKSWVVAIAIAALITAAVGAGTGYLYTMENDPFIVASTPLTTTMAKYQVLTAGTQISLTPDVSGHTMTVACGFDAPGTIAITDSGNGGEGSYTVSTPDKSSYIVTCADADGCGLYFADTGATNGMRITFVVTGSNTTTAREVTGKLEGAATLAATDSMTVEYVTDSYYVIGASNN